MSDKDTALIAQEAGFMTLANTDIGVLMAEELNGLDVGFERIKIPAGGSTVFEMPGEDGEPENVKEFSAVILCQHPLNAYYKTKYTGGNNPPDCSSFDGIDGVGIPGGKCETCPYNRFGSGENGAKACKNRRRIYALREGEVFPLLLSLPTGSLTGFTKYLMRLIGKKVGPNAVVTRFSLKKATSKKGVVFSQALFDIDRYLTPEEYPLIKNLSAQIKESSKAVSIDYDRDTVIETEKDDYMVDEETGEIIRPLGGGSDV